MFHLSSLIEQAVQAKVMIVEVDKSVQSEQGYKYWVISFPPDKEIVWHGDNSFEKYLDCFILHLSQLIRCSKENYTDYYLDKESDILLVTDIVQEMLVNGSYHLDLSTKKSQLLKIKLDAKSAELKKEKAEKKKRAVETSNKRETHTITLFATIVHFFYSSVITVAYFSQPSCSVLSTNTIDTPTLEMIEE